MCKNDRASGFRTVLVCFLQIYECVDPTEENGIPILRNNFKSIEAFCSNAPALDADTKAHIRYVFGIFHELIEEDRSIFESQSYKKTRVFSPIELVAVACLISQKGAERPKGMLRGDILALRAHLREVHSDIRLTKPCWKTAWKFIDTIEHHRGAVDGTTIRKKPPKIVKKKPQPCRTGLSFTDVNAGSQARSAEVSMAMMVNKDEGCLSNTNENERLSNTAGKNEQKKHAMSLHSPKNPSMHEFPKTMTSEGDRIASRRKISNTPVSVSSHMSSTALRESFARGVPSRLASFKSILDQLDSKLDSEGTTPQEPTSSGSGTPWSPSVRSLTSENTAIGHGSVAAPRARKRVALDLGRGSSGTHELEYKKARLMAGYVKKERDS